VQQLDVAARLVARDPGQVERREHRAHVLVLELDRGLAALAQLRAQFGIEVDLAVALLARLVREHREVARNAGRDLGRRPVLADVLYLDESLLFVVVSGS